jgi:hypothetical protein
MSQTPEAPDELPETFEAKVIAQLTVYSIQKDAKGKTKESKAQKTKELVFVFSENNYVEFLQVLLAKHSQEKYKATERRPYTFKYLHPPSKACVIYLFIFAIITHTVGSASNAVDVDSVKDWKDMYEDIAVVLPKKIKVLIDLKIVKRLCRLNVSVIPPRI